MNQPSNPLLNQQPQYHQPQQFGQQQAPVMTIGDWIVTSIVLAIPLVNLIMAFVWGFGSNTNPNKANYCKAWLIVIAIFVALYILLVVFAIGAGAAAGRYQSAGIFKQEGRLTTCFRVFRRPLCLPSDIFQTA